MFRLRWSLKTAILGLLEVYTFAVKNRVNLTSHEDKTNMPTDISLNINLTLIAIYIVFYLTIGTSSVCLNQS